MKQYLKDLRKQSYLMNIWDDVNLPHTENYVDIVDQIVNFFNTESQLIYPAKAYFVAIVYAKCMEKYFFEDFYKMLDDPELLSDDKYFVTYENDKNTYDSVLVLLKKDILSYPSTQKTENYFKKEFLIGANYKTYR